MAQGHPLTIFPCLFYQTPDVQMLLFLSTAQSSSFVTTFTVGTSTLKFFASAGSIVKIGAHAASACLSYRSGVCL